MSVHLSVRNGMVESCIYQLLFKIDNLSIGEDSCTNEHPENNLLCLSVGHAEDIIIYFILTKVFVIFFIFSLFL